jgi:hypothetical protein
MAPRSVYRSKKAIPMKGGRKKPTRKGIKRAMGSPRSRPGGANTEHKQKVGMGKLRRTSRKRK